MTDDDIQAFLHRAPDRSLVGLEGAVWREVARREAADRGALAVVVLQGGALVLALLAGLSWGAMSANSRAEPKGFGVFSPRMALAPSTRLIGTGG